MELPKNLFINSRFVVITFGESAAYYLTKIGVAGIVLRKKDKVVVSVVAVSGLLVKS